MGEMNSYCEARSAGLHHYTVSWLIRQVGQIALKLSYNSDHDCTIKLRQSYENCTMGNNAFYLGTLPKKDALSVVVDLALIALLLL